MSKYRKRLPQLADRLFLTDGGLETTLIFHQGIALPHFAAFDLLGNLTGTDILRRYFSCYSRLASSLGVGAVLESPTWRANPVWGAKLGYDSRSLAQVNRQGIELLEEVRLSHQHHNQPIVISGNLGPRGDGYRADVCMTVRGAYDYHAAQVEAFASSAADMVAAFTMTYAAEAIGITLAARAAGMPVAISFTVETDGHLPSGETLAEAICRTDDASSGYPAYFMVNCAHPEHFEPALREPGSWRGRIRGFRANASKRSHAELDCSADLDIGSPADLANKYRALRELMPRLTILGGCCGTDARHVQAVIQACQPDPLELAGPEPRGGSA